MVTLLLKKRQRRILVTFKKVHIKNFKSIKEATLEFKSGVWEVTGDNQDADYESNASGKTTTLEATQQCLFNRTTLNAPIEDMSRKGVGNSKQVFPFEITVWFDKDGHSYEVINSRRDMKITVKRDGADLGIKSIPQSLKRIQEIIGMDFNTFTTLTFITVANIGDLLDNFSSSALMKIILDFNQITRMDKNIKDKLKVLKEKIKAIQDKIKSTQDSIEVLEKYSIIDTQPFHQEKVSINSKMEKVQEDIDKKREALHEIGKNLAEIETVESHIKSMKDNKCKCCGTQLEFNADLYKERLTHLEELKLPGNTTRHVEEIKEQIDGLNEQLHILFTKLNKVSNEILVADTKNQMYQENLNKSEELRKDLITLNTDYDELGLESDILTTATAIIKSGQLHKALLVTFTTVLNTYIGQFKDFVNLKYIHVEAVTSKSSVDFSLVDTRFGQKVHINTLSGGEKTRLRFIILLSMLYTIKDLTGAYTNLLVLDESLDTLDKSASKDLAILFDYMIGHDNKFIALVSHGQQLQDIKFTGKIRVTKSHGISEIKVDTND
jgi:archaellum component FlaC